MASSSRRLTNSDPSETSSTTTSAEIAQDIIEDVSVDDDDSTSNPKKNNKDDGQTNADDDDGEHSKLTEFHAKNYFNSTMGGKDLRALFAMAIGCNSMDLPDHKEPPFSRSKIYHSDIKPDSATLKLEVTRRWKAYKTSCRQPRPANWKMEKAVEYLMNNPIPPAEVLDRHWLKTELEEWKGIQEMINESQQHSADKVIHRTWSNDIPYLRLYHTLVDDNIRRAFGEAYAVKTREELDRRNSGLYKSFYEKAAEKFNDKDWIPHSIVFPDLHEDFEKSKPLPLNVAPITAEQFKKKLTDNRYKMVKVIADWERSGSGRGMVKNLQSSTSNDDEDTSDDNDGRKQTEMEVYEFWDGDDRKSYLRERPSHVLYLWQLSYTYKILNTVRQQLCSDSTMDGSCAPDVRQVRKRKSSPESNDPSVITNRLSDNIQQIANSINGLVGVAKQSQHMQERQMLYARRKELEDTIKDLEGSAMELEIKSLDETGIKKELLEKAVLKKKNDILAKQKELGETIHSIRCNTEGTPSAVNSSMPRFVNLAWNSDEENDN